MSTDALAMAGATSSLAQQVAGSLALKHWFVDPDEKERSRLKIESHQDIQLRRIRQNLPWDLESIKTDSAFSIRELYWLERILENDTWPILMICGADHVSSFPARCEHRGIHVQLHAPDWEPARI
jgi:hypothetical protein